MPQIGESWLTSPALTRPAFEESELPAGAANAVPLPSPWVRGPAWDGFWMLSALWLAPIILWLCHGYSDPEDSPLDLLYFGLTALFWIGHRLSSTYLAYCTEAYRPLLRSQPVRFVVLPLLVTAACFAVVLPSDTALPWSREERLVALAILDYVFVTYHFATQHFGALSLYRTRVGRAACTYTRSMDRLFALGVGGVLVFLADILAGAVAYQDQWVDRWVFPAWLVSAQDEIRAGATIILLAATAAMLFVELRSPRWSLPRLLYVLGIAAMVALALRPAESVSFPRNLDFAALDSRDGDRFPNADRRAGSRARCWAPAVPRIEHAAVGHSGPPCGCVGHALAAVRSRSDRAGWDILWGPNIRRYRDGIAHVFMGSCTPGPRLRDRVHPLSSRPERLSNVESPSPRGGSWSSRSNRQSAVRIFHERTVFAGRIQGEQDSKADIYVFDVISCRHFLSRAAVVLRCIRISARAHQAAAVDNAFPAAELLRWAHPRGLA